MTTLADTVGVLRDVLRLGERADGFTESTPLLGSIPELDSMAVVSILTAMEERFEIIVEDDEISGETFESVGSLHEFLLGKLDS